MDENTNTTPAADTSAAENRNAEDQTPAEITSETAQTEKTFTQKELDDIVRNRLERAKKDMPSKDELKAFREWQDSRKTAEQKSADDLAAANTARETAENEKRALEIKVSCLSKGVSPEYADDVIALAERYSDENTPIETAISRLIAKYPSFCGGISHNAAPGITTGIRTQAFPENRSENTSFIDIVKENQAKRK